MEIGSFIQFCWICTLIILCDFVKVSGSFFPRLTNTTPVPERNQHVNVYRGETAVLKCAVKNLGPKTVAWRKVSEDYALSVGKMMYAPHEEMSIDYHQSGLVTHVNLVIKRTQLSHAGKYECQLIGSGVKLQYVTLRVLTENPVFKHAIKLDGSVYLSPKQRLNLTCNATGTTRAPEFIDWFYSGNLIDERKPKWRNRATIFSYRPESAGRSLISQLTIEHVTPGDAGIYVCRSMTPSSNSEVETTSITVHILNAEKDHLNKREGQDHSEDAQEQNAENKCFTMHTGKFHVYQVVLTLIIIKLIR